MRFSPQFAAAIALIFVVAIVGAIVATKEVRENETASAKIQAQAQSAREVYIRTYRELHEKNLRNMYEFNLRTGTPPAKAKEDLDKALAEMDRTHPLP